MAFAETLQRTWRENILFSVLIELTYRCNLNCFFCYNDTSLKGVPLSKAQYFQLFEDLCGLGTLNLTLSGGEPLAHPEFFALGRKARELGFLVRVKSNGHALHGALARRMREEVDPFIVETSLHGACAETHDRQTRVPGSFVKLMANVRGALALGLRIKFNSALTIWNEHEAAAMFALADALGVPIQFDPQITRRDDGDTEPLQVAPSAEGIARLYLLQRQRAAAIAANGGSLTAESADGAPESSGGSLPRSIAVPVRRRSSSIRLATSIRACNGGGVSAASTTNPSDTLWNHSDELAEVRRLAADAKQAVDRHATPGFSFCPGTAEQETGHATQLYPVAKLLLDLRKRIPRGLILGPGRAANAGRLAERSRARCRHRFQWLPRQDPWSLVRLSDFVVRRLLRHGRRTRGHGSMVSHRNLLALPPGSRVAASSSRSLTNTQSRIAGDVYLSSMYRSPPFLAKSASAAALASPRVALARGPTSASTRLRFSVWACPLSDKPVGATTATAPPPSRHSSVSASESKPG